ncbi:MAG: hypothetical protein GX640_02260 [Fibrobacter sp.]|nr:hypothetical protein [Fibrobacter sp.]
MKKLSCLFLSIPLLFSCSKQPVENAIVQVGKSYLSQDDFEAFKNVMRNYPTEFPTEFPGERATISFFVETEAIYQKARPDFAKGSISSSKDWAWKKLFFPAQLYTFDILNSNLGASSEEIENYYNTHKEMFKIENQDSSANKDSVTYQSLADVKYQVVDSIFLSKYKPDSSFLAKYDSARPEESVINQSWISMVRQRTPDFFMRTFYKEYYKTPYTDSIQDVLGDGKIITQEDFDVILSWLPPERRAYFEDQNGRKELVEWLLKWKLFSRKAEEVGYTKSDLYKRFIDWAWKIEVAKEYVKNRIVPEAANTSDPIDTAMVKYAIYDDQGIVTPELDTSIVNEKIAALKRNRHYIEVEHQIYTIRQQLGVKFLQNDQTDQRDQNPATLLAQADSARDTGNIDIAEGMYTTLTKEFAFTVEGKKALAELAKIQTERQSYNQAINNYRKYLLSGVDNSKRCNIFFMIGFIFDEYLDRPELAEVNYKWVLKNTPDCELADDAEFMILHLSEPMSSVEELQEQTRRQGKAIEPDEVSTSIE